MAKHEVRVLSLTQTAEGDSPAFEAAGTIDGTEFKAQTILWGPKGLKEPLFKVVEGEDVAQALSASSFTRGQRIAIARACKMVRLGEAELFSEEEAEEASVEADADSASDEELEAAAEILEETEADNS
jgi:hypothetical protein